VTNVNEIVDRATEQLSPPSQNGGRPPAASALMPVLVLAAAFALGVVVARVLDWRTHAHPDR